MTAPQAPSFAERVAEVERELKDAVDDPDWVYSEPADISAILACIREQQVALKDLHSASEDMRHGGFRNGAVARYDGWAREARACLAKYALEAEKQRAVLAEREFALALLDQLLSIEEMKDAIKARTQIGEEF